MGDSRHFQTVSFTPFLASADLSACFEDSRGVTSLLPVRVSMNSILEQTSDWFANESGRQVVVMP